MDSDLVHHGYITSLCMKEQSLLCTAACSWLSTPTAATNGDTDSGCCHCKPARGTSLLKLWPVALEASGPCCPLAVAWRHQLPVPWASLSRSSGVPLRRARERNNGRGKSHGGHSSFAASCRSGICHPVLYSTGISRPCLGSLGRGTTAKCESWEVKGPGEGAHLREKEGRINVK